METVTQKYLRSLVNSGHTIDITQSEYIEGLEVIGISTGLYGRNGLLLLHRETKQLYAVTARSTSVFMY